MLGEARGESDKDEELGLDDIEGCTCKGRSGTLGSDDGQEALTLRRPSSTWTNERATASSLNLDSDTRAVTDCRTVGSDSTTAIRIPELQGSCRLALPKPKPTLLTSRATKAEIIFASADWTELLRAPLALEKS